MKLLRDRISCLLMGTYMILLILPCLPKLLEDIGFKIVCLKSESPSSWCFKSSAKKKRVAKVIGGGLRQLSIIVCKKVESKGRTTYNEVADAIIADFSAKYNNSAVSLDKFDEKNIRRRVYDALNVLMALDIITKDRKEIHWKGLLGAKDKDVEQIKALCIKLTNQIGKKAAYLKELEEQIAGLQNLMLRNKELFKSGNLPFGGFSLPFIVVQTSPRATVEIEISEDMQLVHVDFDSTPFSLHDDAQIVKLLSGCKLQLPEGRFNISQTSSILSCSNSETDKLMK